MRILIAEEALRLGNGHWPRYVADLAAGFRAEGDVVEVLGHREANDKVKSVVPDVVPWLSRDCRADARSQGLLGGIRHNLCLKRELGAWLKAREPYDWILSLSSRPKHLLAFAMLARAGYCARSRFLLLFVISPGQQDEAGKFRLSASNLFAKFCFALLRPAVCRGQVVIAAETEGMQAEIERFSDLRTVLFPHPVEAAQTREENAEKLKAETLKKDGTTKGAAHRTTGRQDDGQQDVTTNYTNFHERGRQGDAQGTCAGASEPDSLTSKLADSPVSESLIRSAAGPASSPATSHSLLATAPKALALDSPAKPVLVVAPGLARYEKGSDIFQEAIKLILSNEVASAETTGVWGCAGEPANGSPKGESRGRDRGNRVSSAQNQSAAGLSEPVTNYSLPSTAALPTSAPRDPLLATAAGRPLRFVMQWPEDFDFPDGRRCEPDSDLLKDERVKFSKDLLTGYAYWDFLQQADVIVLPYRSESYRARVSRVAIEAAILGKPMVYTKGTWISEVVAMGGAGVAIAEETPQSLAEAIQMAIGDLDALQSEAERGVARVREFYSVSSFHHLLGKVGGNKKSNIAE